MKYSMIRKKGVKYQWHDVTVDELFSMGADKVMFLEEHCGVNLAEFWECIMADASDQKAWEAFQRALKAARVRGRVCEEAPGRFVIRWESR